VTQLPTMVESQVQNSENAISVGGETGSVE